MIRLQRVGKKNQAMFRLVLTDKQNGPKSGRFKEILGSYNPHKNEIQFDTERITYWIGNGAQVSDTVHNLLVKEGVIKGKKKNVLPKKSPVVKEAKEAAEEAPKEETSTSEESTEAPKDESTETEIKEEEVKEKPAEEKPEEPKEETLDEEKEKEPAEEKPTD